MSEYFNRKVELTIGDYSTDELRVDFSVEKSLVGIPNLAKITVYNVSVANREQLSVAGQEVSLLAGYQNPLLIFSGKVINANPIYESPDWKVEIFARDKSAAINNSTINKSLPADTRPEQLYDELVGQMEGVTKGITDGLSDCINNKRSLLRSLQLSGGIKKFLDELAENCGFDYAVADGIIDTVKKDKAITDLPAIIINQNHGMIGSPERTEVGVNVKTLLNPGLKLGRRIEIQAVSQTINAGNLFFRKPLKPSTEGSFRIDKIIHSGSNYDNKWESQITARNYNG